MTCLVKLSLWELRVERPIGMGEEEDEQIGDKRGYFHFLFSNDIYDYQLFVHQFYGY